MITVQLDMWPQKDMSHMNDKTTTTTHTHTHGDSEKLRKKNELVTVDMKDWSFKKEKQ